MSTDSLSFRYPLFGRYIHTLHIEIYDRRESSTSSRPSRNRLVSLENTRGRDVTSFRRIQHRLLNGRKLSVADFPSFARSFRSIERRSVRSSGARFRRATRIAVYFDRRSQVNNTTADHRPVVFGAMTFTRSINIPTIVLPLVRRRGLVIHNSRRTSP